MTPYDKAAALLHGLATAHPFDDGNKRTALAASLMLLECYNITRVDLGDDTVAYAVIVESLKCDADGAIGRLAVWLRAGAIAARRGGAG